MKILLMSDTHFGFASGTERWEDSFLAFEEGIEKGLQYDIILLGGDIFDVRVPTTETLARTMEILVPVQRVPSPVSLVEGIRKKITTPLRGVPIVSIHGNHERRVKGLVNPVEALEKGGFLIHLHCNGVVFEKNGEKIAIFGISSVPGHYASSVFEECQLHPIPGCYNILIFHQNLEGFLYSETPLPLSIVPEGFDLYICGDIHDTHRSTLHGSPLLLPGSTVSTQITTNSCSPRVYVSIDTAQKTFDFIPFERQRKIYYETFEKKEDAQAFISNILQEKHALPPVVKIRASFPPEELAAYQNVLLMISHDKEIARFTIEEQKLSAQQSGKKLLEKNLTAAKLNTALFEEVFELLLHKKQDDTLSLLKQKIT